MLGGSPISVAVPPMLEAKICDEQEGVGRDPQLLGDDHGHRHDQQHRRHVVEEGRDDGGDDLQHEQDAGRMRPGLSRRPDRQELEHAAALVMATMIIMPTSRPMVLKSTPRTAASWLMTPSRIMSAGAEQGDDGAVDLLGHDHGVGGDRARSSPSTSGSGRTGRALRPRVVPWTVSQAKRPAFSSGLWFVISRSGRSETPSSRAAQRRGDPEDLSTGLLRRRPPPRNAGWTAP